jgi:RimJ/RimL family protein N-acetyltransferase
MSAAELLLKVSVRIPVPIVTARLRLRPFDESDVENITKMLADPETTRWIGGAKSATEAAASVARMRDSFHSRGWGTLAVESLEETTCIGYCGVRPLPYTNDVEIAYSLLKSHWGLGYATEASVACLNWAFDILPTDSVVATVYPGNVRCLSVLKKLSMKQETAVFAVGPESLALLYRVTKSAWLARGHVENPEPDLSPAPRYKGR